MRFVFVVLCLVGFSLPAFSETAAERLARLMTEDFVRQSADALGTGDRNTAILTALRAIPAEPVEADLETFAEGFSALHRAVVSRAIRLPLQVESYAAFGPLGHRVATIGALPFDGVEASGEPLKLWELPTGKLLAAPVPIASTTSEGVGPPEPRFSPDGRHLAIVANQSGEVIVINAEMGAIRWSTQAYAADGISLGLAFSSDSRMLLTTGGDPFAVTVWDVASGQQLYRRQAQLGCLFGPVYGAPDGAVYFIEQGLEGICDVPVSLNRFDGTTASQIVDLSASVSVSLNGGGSMDASGTRLLLMKEDFGVVVIGLDGSVLADLPPSLTGGELGEFARRGEAIAFPFYHGETAAGVKLYAFDGTPLETTSDDLLPFVHAVYTPGGVTIGWAARAGNDYLGTDVPRDLALYKAVWDWASEDIRAEIDADRVIRP